MEIYLIADTDSLHFLVFKIEKHLLQFAPRSIHQKVMPKMSVKLHVTFSQVAIFSAKLS